MTVLEWVLEIERPPAEAWAVFADTDGFNRAAGLDFHFERVQGVMRGRTKVAGISSTWLETPITWNRPSRFVSERTYDSGPIKTATATCTFTPGAKGTTINYRVELAPRNALLALPVKALAATLIRPGLYRALMNAKAVVHGEKLTVDPPPPLTDAQRQALDEALDPIDRTVADALRRRIEEEPLPAQHSLRPLQIAADEGLDPEDVLRECLLASTSGALELDLQILCPNCRGAHHHGSVIELRTKGLHCPTCDIRYDGHLSENMEVVFGPGKQIRDVEVPVDCVFSPQKTPHVVSKVRIKAGRTTNWEVTLEPGGYRLEAPHGDTWIVADPTCDSDRVFVDLKPAGPMPAGLRVKPGRVRITARNRNDDSALVSIRDRWRPIHALTVAELFTYPSASEVLPEGITAGLDTRIEPGVVVAIEGPPSAVKRALQRLESPITELVDNELALLVCPDAALAIEEVERLGSAHDFISVGVGTGLVVAISDGESTSLGGPAVEVACRVMASAGRPGNAVQTELLEQAREILGERCVVRERGALAAQLVFPVPQIEPTPEAQPPPERIGPYHVLGTLAPGVLQVRDDKERRWALKWRGRSESRPEWYQRFLAEGHLAHKHRHRNLVEVFDWSEHEGHPYIVMELLVGESLDAVLEKRRRLPEKEVRPLLQGLAKALTALAEAGMPHRALKPSNVFLLAQPTDVPHAVELLDYGLLRDAAPEATEQDPRTDVYALAALTYRMLSGKPAWRGDELSEQALPRLGTAPDQLDFGRVPPLWVPVLTQALSLDASERFAGPEAFVAALLAAEGG